MSGAMKTIEFLNNKKDIDKDLVKNTKTYRFSVFC